MIFDGGSGLRELGKYLASDGLSGKEYKIFITHYHWDHIQGIPFFQPLFNEKNKIIFYGQTSNGVNIQDVLSQQMTPSFFPIKIEEFMAEVDFEEVNAKKKYNVNGMNIETFQVNHPSPTLTYKISSGGKIVIYMTDNELHLNDKNKIPDVEEIKNLNNDLINFCSNCDYLIHDSMYDEPTVHSKKGWGHSGNISLALFSILAKVKNLVLFHYNPDYSDAKIDALLDETKSILKKNNSSINCIAAKEGLEINI